jgi:predicted NBD/HSP70 family sugar kinase
MKKNILSTIKYDSVREILDSAARHEKISRAEIAAETGLSLMTVGKVADALLELDIVIQSKETRSEAGRKAGLIKLNPMRFCIVFDIKDRQFRAYVINAELNIVGVHAYVFDENYYYDENLCLFLQSSRLYFDKEFNMDLCFGVGTILPVGSVNINSGDMINERYDDIKRTAERILSVKSILYETSIDGAAALYKSRNASRRILYIMLGNSSGGAFINGDKVVFASGFGDLILQSGTRFTECMNSADGDETAADDLAVLLYNISQILSPDEIIFETSEKAGANKFISGIKSRMIKFGIQLPFTYTPETPPSVIGIARLLRSDWFDITARIKKPDSDNIPVNKI